MPQQGVLLHAEQPAGGIIRLNHVAGFVQGQDGGRTGLDQHAQLFFRIAEQPVAGLDLDQLLLHLLKIPQNAVDQPPRRGERAKGQEEPRENEGRVEWPDSFAKDGANSRDHRDLPLPETAGNQKNGEKIEKAQRDFMRDRDFPIE